MACLRESCPSTLTVNGEPLLKRPSGDVRKEELTHPLPEVAILGYICKINGLLLCFLIHKKNPASKPQKMDILRL